ncbi:hypothetical protein BGX28_010355 [Mortierella sp. GBA30]|nr:hypothetical protein BGX28_010355 [Mortierella sp. GBA30]
MAQDSTAPSSSPIVQSVELYKVPTNNHMQQEPKDIPAPSGIDRLRSKMSPLLLYVVSTAQFLDIVNGASVAVALLPIADHLHFKASEMLWIVNAYTIAFAGLLLVSGRLGDLFGHRPMFLFGLFWFSSWALVVSFSVSPVMLIISRALQGVGAASTIPTAMALIATNYPPGPQRTRAFSIFGAFGGMGALTGILLAGGLISSIGWEWIFRLSSIVGFMLFALGFFSIPLTPLRTVRPKVDYLGALTATLGVVGIVYYISTGVKDGWVSPKTLPVLFVGLLMIGTFIFIESKVEAPLMPIRIWKNRNFSASVLIAFLSFGMIQGVIYYVNLVFQEVYQWNSLQTALGFLVHAILAIVSFTILGRILHRLSLKPLILTGFTLRCGTALLFVFVTEHVTYWRLAFPGLIIHVIGAACTLLPVQITAVREADNKDQGLVGAIYNTGLQLGAPFVVAILNIISTATNGNGSSEARGGPVLMKGYRNAFYGVLAMGVFGLFVAMIVLPWDKPSRPARNATEECGGSKDLEVGAIPVDGPKADDDANTVTSQPGVPGVLKA